MPSLARAKANLIAWSAWWLPGPALLEGDGPALLRSLPIFKRIRYASPTLKGKPRIAQALDGGMNEELMLIHIGWLRTGGPGVVDSASATDHLFSRDTIAAIMSWLQDFLSHLDAAHAAVLAALIAATTTILVHPCYISRQSPQRFVPGSEENAASRSRHKTCSFLGRLA